MNAFTYNFASNNREQIYMVETHRARTFFPEIVNRTSIPEEMDNVKATTEQLRVEAQIVRKKVSEVSKDLMEYCEKNKAGDMLVSGPTDQHNPFQEKKSCSML
ncbi:unnamed protein product [Caenorhabditis angaria]|uniref:Guanine nucleotide-binding protein subunit gamma n=1 Tax=Caenorhabditis angaria TaxID=860376 RepID=A0A9P1J043_9PELO|nr:unnamed protein product [Caenorhabditis angaria]